MAEIVWSPRDDINRRSHTNGTDSNFGLDGGYYIVRTPGSTDFVVNGHATELSAGTTYYLRLDTFTVPASHASFTNTLEFQPINLHTGAEINYDNQGKVL